MPGTAGFSLFSLAVTLQLLLATPPAEVSRPGPDDSSIPRADVRTTLGLVTMTAWPGKRVLEIELDNKRAEIPLPKEGGQVREILAAPWMKEHIVAVVECFHPEEQKHHYYWTTISHIPFAERIDPESPGYFWSRFHSCRENLDIASVKNPPGSGDSIYILLAKRTREWNKNHEPISNHLTLFSYVNDCPRGPSIPGILREQRIEMLSPSTAEKTTGK